MNQFYQLRTAVEQEHWAYWQPLFPSQQHLLLNNNPSITPNFINPYDQHPPTLLPKSSNRPAEHIYDQEESPSFSKKELECGQTMKEETYSNDSQFQPALQTPQIPSQNQTEGRARRKGYPTNNFLPAFRQSFLSYLKKHYRGRQQEFNEIEIIARIKGKKGINLVDYRDMFNYGEFRPILQNYFSQRVIFRDLMLSGVRQQLKRHYLGKVYVFEQAFRSGQFQKINY